MLETIFTNEVSKNFSHIKKDENRRKVIIIE